MRAITRESSLCIPTALDTCHPHLPCAPVWKAREKVKGDDAEHGGRWPETMTGTETAEFSHQGASTGLGVQEFAELYRPLRGLKDKGFEETIGQGAGTHGM